MMKPTATTCMAVFWSIPKSPQASGMSMRDPPGTPEVPAAQTEDTTQRKTAVQRSTLIPSEYAAESVITVIVTAAPAMLIVAPSGIETL